MSCFLDLVMHIFVRRNSIHHSRVYHFYYVHMRHLELSHYVIMLIRLACFFVLPTIYLLLPLVIMFTHAYFRRVVTHALHSFLSSKSQRSMKVCTAFLVACIGYHDNNCKQTMMPNALWIRKDGLLGILHRLINMFVMHSITMPWCIHHISLYHVKVKNLELASLQKLGQRMDQVQGQAFSKVHGKIWDLAMIEVSVEAIASLTQYYDQSLRCFTFGDF